MSESRKPLGASRSSASPDAPEPSSPPGRRYRNRLPQSACRQSTPRFAKPSPPDLGPCPPPTPTPLVWKPNFSFGPAADVTPEEELRGDASPSLSFPTCATGPYVPAPLPGLMWDWRGERTWKTPDGAQFCPPFGARFAPPVPSDRDAAMSKPPRCPDVQRMIWKREDHLLRAGAVYHRSNFH
ncbi:uncharacterized protein LOC129653134 [Bubalus kerabau]|uniref:uncharacterized protein LOC129653134 n=1 Tax=Bubalus carabanensis TaxID=3119969 RepID=UPI00244ED3AC|nr:uncharacterized protein LOC129653134 [Bubalus carabanensis]